MKSGQTLGYRFLTQIAGAIVSACCLNSASAGQAPAAAVDPEAAARTSWRVTMAHNDASPEGCFHAAYPSLVWEATSCKVAHPGASVTVKVALTDGSTSGPTCVADAGSTGETNNLNLGSCTATARSAPFIEFTESD